MRIGIVTAMYEETKPLYERLATGKKINTEIKAGMNISIAKYNKHTIYLINCGIGEIRAAMATQILVDNYKVERILNFGFVGALSNKCKLNDLVIVDKTVHYQFDLEKINGTPKGQYNNRQQLYFITDQDITAKIQQKTSIKAVTLASGDEFIAETTKKDWLVATFNADICDMEMAGISLVCENNKVPAVSLKIVSDNANEEANQTFEETVKKGVTKYETILEEVLGSL